uniref:Uncharacterized protein n=1 Tax=Romanomermis culicivorax TaxID=13658 RepID=A0A915I3J2_ROMCU
MERLARELNSTRDTVNAYKRARSLVENFGQKLLDIGQLFESFRSKLHHRIFYDDLPDILKLVEKLIPQLQAASNFELTFPSGDFMPKSFRSLYKMDLNALIHNFDLLKNFLSRNLVSPGS